MAKARHEMPTEIAALSLDEIAERYIGRFRDKKGDWEAFGATHISGAELRAGHQTRAANAAITIDHGGTGWLPSPTSSLWRSITTIPRSAARPRSGRDRSAGD